MRMACTRAISSGIVRCPIGKLQLIACTNGLHEIRLDQLIADDENCAPVIDKQLPVTMESNDVSHEILQDTFAWLQKYFSREQSAKTPALCLPNNGSDDRFMIKCWLKALNQVPFGQTVSYGQLANMTDNNPKAARAVGQAMRRNKFALLVPCHRVVRADGTLGRYFSCKGDHIKRWLIDFEKSD